MFKQKGLIIMRLMHIADLHIGKKLNGISLIEDQKYILNQMICLIEEEKIDGLLIAGDVYQQAQPSNEAMMLFDDFLSQLVKMEIPVYMISGNHDSEERIAYFSKLIQKSKVFASSLFTGTTQIIQTEDAYGKLNIHLLPFIKPIDVRKYYPDMKVDSYQKAMEIVIEHSMMNKEERNILLCHQFITGGQISDSEVFAIGTLDNINHQVFDDFDYVALGHLHHPQHVGREEVRYSGSPLKYSLSEVKSNKSITVIEIKEKGNIQIEKIPLKPLHDLREIKGLFKDIMDMPYSEDFVSISLTDDFVIPDAYLSLMTNYPNMIQFRILKQNEVVEQQDLENIENKSVLDLFVDFYRGQNNDQQPSIEQMTLLEKILDELEEDEK